ncbi:MAG: hypothetical protein FJZ61_01935 [Chlamydiae bacterium]|nr:hypothetical protein [Chlamydiota bacterium]
MVPLKVIPLSSSSRLFTEEEISCFETHLDSLRIPFTPIIQNCGLALADALLDILKNQRLSVALMTPALRIVTAPEKFLSLKCDLACFTNHKVSAGTINFVDNEFLLLHPKRKTILFIEEWKERLQKDKSLDLFLVLSNFIKVRALSMEIFSISNHLKKEAVNDSPFFLRWLMRI